MSKESSGRPLSRRSALKVGLGVAAGTGLAVANPFGARSASAEQSGAQLCDSSGDSASAYGLGSGDLCIPYSRVHDGSWGYVWGDSYSGMQQSGYLGSPTMLCQSGFDSSGATPISFTYAMPSGTAKQLFNYTHNADNGYGYEVSRIPNDCIGPTPRRRSSATTSRTRRTGGCRRCSTSTGATSIRAVPARRH